MATVEQRIEALEAKAERQQAELDQRAKRITETEGEVSRLRQVIAGMAAVGMTAMAGHAAIKIEDTVPDPPAAHAFTADS